MLQYEGMRGGHARCWEATRAEKRKWEGRGGEEMGAGETEGEGCGCYVSAERRVRWRGWEGIAKVNAPWSQCRRATRRGDERMMR